MEVEILIQNVLLKGDLVIPEGAMSLIVFAHENSSSWQGKGNEYIASELGKSGFATLLFDLLTKEEYQIRKNRFNVELLTERLIGVTKWCMENQNTEMLKIGYLGANMGSTAALSAAAYWGTKIRAVVSRGGRPDLAMEELDLIEAPVLLIVGGEDKEGIDQNRKAYIKIGCTKKMEVVVGATHIFEEEGALEKVAILTKEWFIKHMIQDE